MTSDKSPVSRKRQEHGFSPSQFSKWLPSPMKNDGEAPLSPYLFSPGGLPNDVLQNGGPEHQNNTLGAFSPGIFSPGAKLLKKRYSSHSVAPSPERIFLPGFQQSSVFDQATSQGVFGGTGTDLNFQSYDQYSQHLPKSTWADIQQENLPEPQERGRNGGRSHRISRNSQQTEVLRSSTRQGNVRSTRHEAGQPPRIGPAHISPQVAHHGTPPAGYNVESDSPVRVSKCNCKKSRCLKLYCECFANLRYCVDCNCMDCHNTKDHEQLRKVAIKTAKERNSSAFTSKVGSNKAHSTGCHCKNSLCLKKYCECFQAGAHCGINCKCLSCQNFAGSAALDAIKSSERYGDRKRKGSPAAAVVSANNTPEERFVKPTLTTPPKDDNIVASGRVTRARAQRGNGTGNTAVGPTGVVVLPQVTNTPPPSSEAIPATYPFFGPDHPECPKLVALKVLDYLDNKDIYSASITSTYWARASMDDALWTQSY